MFHGAGRERFWQVGPRYYHDYRVSKKGLQKHTLPETNIPRAMLVSGRVMSRLLMDFADQLIQLPRHHPSVVIAGFLFSINSTHSIHLCYVTLGLKPPSRKVKYYNGWKLFTLKLPSTLKVLKLCPRPRVQLARRCGLKSSDGCFFVAFFFPTGVFGQNKNPTPKN